MYPVYADLFATALKEHEQEQLIAYKDRFNRGFEVPFTFCHEQKPYTFRMIVLFDRNLCHRKQATLERRIEKTNTEFAQLCGKLNKYKLKERDRIGENMPRHPEKKQYPRLLRFCHFQRSAHHV